MAVVLHKQIPYNFVEEEEGHTLVLVRNWEPFVVEELGNSLQAREYNLEVIAEYKHLPYMFLVEPLEHTQERAHNPGEVVHIVEVEHRELA